MEPPRFVGFCCLCNEEIVSKFIIFSCNHYLCLSCSPYLFLGLFQGSPLRPESFSMDDLKISCLKCQTGQAMIYLPKLMHFYGKSLKKPEKPKEIKCESCEKAVRDIFCADCKMNICQGCFDTHHTPIKKYATHAIFPTKGEESLHFKFPCKCPSRLGMSTYCQDCHEGFCKECIATHEGHKTVDLKSFYDDNEFNLSSHKLLSQAIEDLNKMEKIIESQTSQYTSFLNKTIRCLTMMREKSEKDKNKMKARIRWFLNYMNKLMEDLDQLRTMHPNKLTHLNNFGKAQPANLIRMEKEETPYYMKDFKKSFEDIFNEIDFTMKTKIEFPQQGNPLREMPNGQTNGPASGQASGQQTPKTHFMQNINNTQIQPISPNIQETTRNNGQQILETPTKLEKMENSQHQNLENQTTPICNENFESAIPPKLHTPTPSQKEFEPLLQTPQSIFKSAIPNLLPSFALGKPLANGNSLFALSRYNNFMTNANKFQEKNTTVLDFNCFDFAFDKSNVTSSFAIQHETFLAWGGPKSPVNGKFSLQLFNLSRRRREIIFEDLNAPISVINTFPIDSAYDMKKLLYFADGAGVLRVLDLTNKYFNEVVRIDTQTGRVVIGMMLFEDKFNELKNENNKDILALVSFNDASLPLKIYNCQQGTLVKEFYNPTGFCCFSINYFIDEKENRLRFFLGFSKSNIMELNITNGLLQNSFRTQGGVSSINFIFREKKRWIVFTQENSGIITVGNLKNGQILNEKNVGFCSSIYDLCVWNMKNQAIVVGSMENQPSSIMIVDIKTLNVTNRIEFKETRPVNVQKVIVMHPKFQKSRESIVVFQKLMQESAVVLYD